jgi:hypothetical protein
VEQIVMFGETWILNFTERIRFLQAEILIGGIDEHGELPETQGAGTLKKKYPEYCSPPLPHDIFAPRFIENIVPLSFSF